MAEKNYGELCKECGEYHTKHPSGICSRCRKLKGSKPCIVCGTHKTVAPDGLCSACRIKTLRKKNGGVSIEKAIEDTELLLAMLKNRANGMSYEQISEVLGVPRSTVYFWIMRALTVDTKDAKVENIPEDGAYDKLFFKKVTFPPTTAAACDEAKKKAEKKDLATEKQ